MRILFAIALSIAAMPVIGQVPVWVGPDCNISWDANPPSELVEGYRVYVTQQDPLIVNQQSVGTLTQTTCTELGLAQGRYEVYVTAYNPAGESVPSNVVPFVLATSVPGGPGGVSPPSNLKVTVQ